MGEKQNQLFQLSFNASLKVDFQGSQVTSDGGLILVQEFDQRLGFSELIEQHLTDPRGKNTQLPLTDLLRQSLYSRPVGGAWYAEAVGCILLIGGEIKTEIPVQISLTLGGRNHAMKLSRASITASIVCIPGLAVFFVIGGMQLQTAELPLAFGEPAPVQATKTVRLVLTKASDVTITTYSYSGAFRTGSTTTPKFEYKLDEDLLNCLKSAEFTVLEEGSPETEDATLFVSYFERKRRPGLDAPTAFYFSFAFYHRTAGRLAEANLKPDGFDSVDALKAHRDFKDLGTLMKNSLRGPSTSRIAQLILRHPTISFEKRLVATIASDTTDFSHIVLSPDRKSVAYAARDKDNQVVIFLNGKPVETCDRIIDRLVFHPNGTSLGYIAERAGGSFFGIDGKASYAFPFAAGLVFSPDGRRFAYVAGRGKSQFVVINGAKGPDFDSIPTTVSFSKKGDTAYWAKRDKTLFLVLNGREERADWDTVTKPTFTGTGELSYAGRKDNKWHIVMKGQTHPLDLAGEILAGPLLSPDGSAHTLVIKRNESYLVTVNDKELRKHKGRIGIPIFSAKGQHIAYTVQAGNKQFIAVNKSESKVYDQIIEPILFTADEKSISFASMRGRELYLEVEPISELITRNIKKESWKAPVGLVVTKTPPLVMGGFVYFASQDSTIYALDAHTGDEAWHFKMSTYAATPSFAVAEGIVCALHLGWGNQTINVLDAKTGAPLWKYPAKEGFTSVPLITEGIVYIVSGGFVRGGGGILRALDKDTGKENWSVRIEEWDLGSQAMITNGRIYLTSRYGDLRALSLPDRKELWRFKGQSQILLGPFSEGTIYFGDSKLLYAIEAATGKVMWKFEADVTVTHPVIADGIVYFGSKDGNVYAIHAKTGEQIRRYPVGCEFYQPKIVDGTMYYECSGDIYAMDLKTAKEVWRYEGEVSNASWPCVSDKTVYFGAGKYLYAVNLRD